MIDVGLLASVVVAAIVTIVFVPGWPEGGDSPSVADVGVGPLLVGVVVGRLAAVALDDPGSMFRLGDLLIIRSGVEFWPGLVAGLAWCTLAARRTGASPVQRLASLVAPALVAWASFEATCLLRDGCPGPVTAIGLRPRGLAERMFPVALLVAALACAAAAAVRTAQRRGAASSDIVVAGVAAVAAIRSVTSWWLPRIGDGITRQHRTSLLAFAVAGAWYTVLRARHRRSPS